jgi:putative transcriptional regulator
MVYAYRSFVIFLCIKKGTLMRNRIKIERATLDITQEELARKIGVSRQTVNSIEKNRYVPSTVLALKISKLFEKSVNDIFELEEED